jgi:hypothetical protein
VFYWLALWWDELGTRVPFSDSPRSLTFPSEQFWGRAARASWVRKNPDARLIFRVMWRGHSCPRPLHLFLFLLPISAGHCSSVQLYSLDAFADKSVRATRATIPLNLWKS